MTNTPFLGLTMPVFSAFSFLADDKAVAFALDQLEQFISALHAKLSREAQTLLPQRGLDRESQAAYLARGLRTEDDLFLTFHVKPTTLRIAVNLLDRAALNRALRTVQQRPDDWMDLLESLGDAWELRCQQMEVDPDTNETRNYKDLFKDRVTTLTPESSAELIDRLVYLNGEDRWLTPIYLTKSLAAEFVAAMGSAVAQQLAQEVNDLLPLLRLFSGGPRQRAGQRRTAPAKTTKSKQREASTSASDVAANRVDEFTFNATLKPLHIRKGFINMTPAHWPFFAVNSRTEVRPVVLKYDGHTDKKSAVWRLAPNDIARLVLSEQVHRWLEEHFAPEDEIQISALKHADESIELELVLVAQPH